MISSFHTKASAINFKNQVTKQPGVTCIRANTSPSRAVPFINMKASVFLRILINRIYFVAYQQETYIVIYPAFTKAYEGPVPHICILFKLSILMNCYLPGFQDNRLRRDG